MTKALWQAVLLRQVEDALRGVETEPTKPNRLRMISQARSYLTTPSRDLITVCSLAGFDPDSVIEHMTRLIAAAPSPEELAMRGRVRQPKERKPKRPRETPVFTLHGETLTIDEWAKRIGTTRNAIYTRLSNGWTLEDTLTLTTDEARHRAKQRMKQSRARSIAGRTWQRGSPPRLLTYNGVTQTIAEWAAQTGLKKSTIKQRLSKGWPISDVLSTEKRKRREPV